MSSAFPDPGGPTRLAPPRSATAPWPAGAALALAVLMAMAHPPAQAQPMGGMGPGGGMGGMGGMGPGGGPPRGTAPRTERSAAEAPPSPWLLWSQRLQAEREALAPDAPRQAALAAVLDELDLTQQLHARRVQRLLFPRPPVLSAVVDIGRDLRAEADEARDWAQQMDDLARRWAECLALLAPPQRARAEAAWQAAFSPPSAPR